jgi:hypothetical protein
MKISGHQKLVIIKFPILGGIKLAHQHVPSMPDKVLNLKLALALF